ncbi:MAG: polysaccharide biosynthesis C-terminal domain-containing protein [Simkaniaceae bacterium]|jgi:MATE family multidrug resistance protein|nr:MAG: polysaccharide biosynthesis C-terminal domain-containing protein [Simkaniaceae bacterium]
MILNHQGKDSSQRITKYPIGSLRELSSLSFPLIISTLSASFLGWCDRYFLSLYSVDAWKASTAATNLTFFFQIVLIMIAFVTQGFIGHYKGAKQEKMIGPFIWQMIYFSFLSMLITYPLSIFSEFYLKGIELEQGAILYLRYLSVANFLYPLGATLAAFYLGRGKTRVVFLSNVLIQGTNILLDYLLIFGVKGFIAPMGIKGAAIATVTSQALYCIVLFTLFLNKKYKTRYSTDNRAFNLPLLLEGLKTGIPRALGRCMVVGAWVFASYFLIHKGGDYFLVYSFGVTVFGFLSFITDGMGQALITLTSYSLGASMDQIFHKILRTSLWFLAIVLVILGIPLLFMQETIIYFMVKSPLTPSTVLLLKECCVWIWIGCFASGINRIGVGFLTASRDTIFYASCVTALWITLCVPVYVGIELLSWTPTKLFMLDSINTSLTGGIFIYRFLKSPYRKLTTRKVTTA